MESVIDGMLNLSFQDLEEIPNERISRSKSVTLRMDISHNLLSDGSFLNGFSSLQILIADYNQFTSLMSFPSIPSLDTLSLVSNQIENLPSTLQYLRNKFPNLEHLTLMKNPCCPFLQPWATENEITEYRYHVINALQQLKTLDGSAVSRKERLDAFSFKNQQQGGDEEVKERVFTNQETTKTQSKTAVLLRPDTRPKKGGISEGNRFITNNDL